MPVPDHLLSIYCEANSNFFNFLSTSFGKQAEGSIRSILRYFWTLMLQAAAATGLLILVHSKDGGLG